MSSPEGRALHVPCVTYAAVSSERAPEFAELARTDIDTVGLMVAHYSSTFRPRQHWRHSMWAWSPALQQLGALGLSVHPVSGGCSALASLDDR